MSPSESEAERDAKAADLAYAKGTADARTAAHFAELDRHVLDINGSVERMEHSLDSVERRLAAIEAREQARDAVAIATSKAVERHGQAQISSRTFALGVVAIIVSIAGLFVSQL